MRHVIVLLQQETLIGTIIFKDRALKGALDAYSARKGKSLECDAFTGVE